MMPISTHSFLIAGWLAAFVFGAAVPLQSARAQDQDDSPAQWGVHDEERPNPPVIEPGTASTQQEPGEPPSDATVLFNGQGDLEENWETLEGEEPTSWEVEDGALVVGDGMIQTKQAFGDVQLHVEFSSPTPAEGEGQGRGNSGVYLMKNYEVQVLDSYENETYADGQAAAVYGQHPPLVNASRPPGTWQTYDIIFHRPHFDDAGVLVEPARMTVLHNGVVVQDNVRLMGPTAYQDRPQYQAHPDELPIMLQDHANPVRYRNIWVRELP